MGAKLEWWSDAMPVLLRPPGALAEVHTHRHRTDLSSARSLGWTQIQGSPQCFDRAESSL